MLFSSIQRSVRLARPMTRQFSSEAAAPSKSAGASLFQRITSFVIGAGLTALGTQYFIYEEIREGNKMMLEKQKDMDKRLSKLENK